MPFNFDVTILYQMLTVIVILVVTYLFGRILSRFFRKTFKKAGIPETQTIVLASIMKYSSYLIGASIALGYLDIPIVSLWIAVVSGVAIVGFTSHSALDNLFSGYFIRTYVPFNIGDVVEMEGQTVKVKDVAPLNTVVEATDYSAYSIPNAKIIQSEFRNYSKYKDDFPVKLKLEIPKETELKDVKLELLKIITSYPKVKPDQPVQIHIQKFTKEGVILKVVFFVEDFHIKSGAKDYVAEKILEKSKAGAIPLAHSNSEVNTNWTPKDTSSPATERVKNEEEKTGRRGPECPKCDSHNWSGFLRCGVCGSYFLLGKCKNCDHLRFEECPIDGGRMEFIKSEETGE